MTIKNKEDLGKLSKYFTADEVLAGKDFNTIPVAMRDNIIPTMALLHKIREHIGVPIIITSSYRSPEYNKQIGGASNSRHTFFQAFDFKVPGYSYGQLKALYDWIDKEYGDLVLGMGVYKGGWIHIDLGYRKSRWEK